MANHKAALKSLAERYQFELLPDGREAFGKLRDFPVQISAVPGKVAALVVLVCFGDERYGEQLKAKLASDAGLGAAGVKAESVEIAGFYASLTFDGKMKSFSLTVSESGSFDVDAVSAGIDALLGSIAAVAPPPDGTCFWCREESGGPHPSLVDGCVGYICSGCLQELQAADEARRAEYDAKTVRYGLAIPAALLVGTLCAVAWAAIGAATGRVFAFAGVAIGAAVSGATVFAAGKGTNAVRALSFVVTILSVLLGQLAMAGYLTHKAAQAEQAEVDWGKFIAAAPEILMDGGGSTLFAVAAAVLGAAIAAKAAGDRHAAQAGTR